MAGLTVMQVKNCNRNFNFNFKTNATERNGPEASTKHSIVFLSALLNTHVETIFCSVNTQLDGEPHANLGTVH